MKKNLKLLLTGLALSGITYTGAQAQALLTYTPNNTSITIAPTVSPTATGEITGGALTFGPAFSFDADPSNFPQTGSNAFGGVIYPHAVPASLSAAVTAGSYFSFFITPTAGNVLNLTDVDFAGVGFFAQNEAATFALESDATGSTVLASYTTAPFYKPGAPRDPNDPDNINPLVNVPVAGGLAPISPLDGTGLTGPVTFYIYVYSTDTADASPFNDTDVRGLTTGGSFSIDGTVTPALTPEPGTYALLGLGLALLIVTVRNRRAARL